MTTALPISSCWVATQDLIGLRHQAIGLAQALGVEYVFKEIKKPQGLLSSFSLEKNGFTPPWPQVLITCGRKSEVASVAVRRASGNKTFTVHVQEPLINHKQFDVVVLPAHDRLRGENVCVTEGAIHHVTPEKLQKAAGDFRSLLAPLPRPVVSVLVGGKNKYQGFSEALARDLAQKLVSAAKKSHGSLAVTFSRRTGERNEAIMRQEFAKVPSYVWDGNGENPYFGMLALADVIVVTSDSMSMISEACSTGKPVYIYELPREGKRHKQFHQSLIQNGTARFFLREVEIWKNQPLDETRKAARFVYERFMRRTNNGADLNARNTA